jgi:hypothetical protein
MAEETITPNGTARAHLHLDGLALLALAIVVYAVAEGPWWLFLALLLAPDLFMLSYLAGPRIGSIVYNAGHALLWPVVLVSAGLLGTSASADSVVLQIGIIWAAHIGMDRAFGFGYKYPTRFNDTDIGRA